MQIQPSQSITLSDLQANPNIVLVRQEIEFRHGSPHQGSPILAGVYQPKVEETGMGLITTIDFNHGRASWMLQTEHFAQRANGMQWGTLPDLIKLFEAKVGVELPLIKIIDPGIGIYSAQSVYASENPWRLEDGKFYTVTDPAKGGTRTFVADVRDGRTLISFIRDGEKCETYEPSLVLSIADWKSLKALDQPETNKSSKRTP